MGIPVGYCRRFSLGTSAYELHGLFGMRTINKTDHINPDQFILHFTFRGQPFDAEVTSLVGESHVQYTVWPKDLELQSQFGAQVFHKIAGKGLQTSFPGDDGPTKAYIAALKDGLQDAVKQSGVNKERR